MKTLILVLTSHFLFLFFMSSTINFLLPVHFIFLSAPMAVTDPLVTPYPTSLCVSWGPPVENGGSSIDSYRLILESSIGDVEQNVTVGGDINFYTFENLVASTNYT